MLTAEKSTDPNPTRALYENFMTGEYGKKWDDLPTGVQKRWADALAAGVVAMTSVRIEPVADFDMEAFRSSALERGKIAVLPTPTDIVFSDGEPYAAMTVDYLGCEYLSRDVEGIEKIAAAGSKGPTEVVYLYAAPPAPSVAEKALDDHTMQKLREALRFSSSRSVMSAADEARILSALSAQVQDASKNMATQIEMGHGKVDVSRIDHEGRSGILFRPRNSFIPVGQEGELPAGEYWPVSGDVVIWIANESGAHVIEKYLADFLPDRSAQVQDVAGTSAADQIIGQIEEIFPNWRSYRDLIDCIYCTLHDLRAAAPAKQEG